MIYILILTTFLSGVLVSLVVSSFFKRPISNILKKLIDDEIYLAWVKYMIFAIYVVGISSGVNLWQLEKFITPAKDSLSPELTSVRWFFEIYRSIISSLQSLAWLLLVFFIIALIVFVIKKIFTYRRGDQV